MKGDHPPAVDLQQFLPFMGVTDQRIARLCHHIYSVLALPDVAALPKEYLHQGLRTA